jgi:mannose-1-phosphate guanylyltransferase
MDRPLVALVLAGGTGTRLFPASRSDRPKQFLAFGGDESLLARTVDRVAFAEETYVLTRERFADAIHDHAPGVGVLTEPEPKDTGPALVYAAARLREQVGDCVLLCVPSDHHVAGAFAPTARRAAEAAVETGGIVALGVEPTRPATGYGYVEPGADRGGYREVVRFHEKPDAETAAVYVDRGWHWNAGIFAWTPAALLREARASPLEPLVAALEAGDSAAGFAAVDPVSVDEAVLERTDEAFVVPAAFEWDDLGTWDALERIRNGGANVTVGDVLALDAADNVLAAGPDARISAVAVDDLVVAAYDGDVLVVPKDRSQRVREVVDELDEPR